MFKITTLKNGLTLITVPLPHLESVTTLVAVGAGSRYETKRINGISHFLEHMFFKGSKKYPTAEEIATLIDSIGAVNNAATDKEVTYYWIKSAAKHLNFASDMLSSMVKDSLLSEAEIEKEKGVIIEELRMYFDSPSRHVWELYEQLQFGDQPLGWQIGGDEKTVSSFVRQEFVAYMNSLYQAENMAVVYAGNLPDNIEEIAEEYFGDVVQGKKAQFEPYQKIPQTAPRVNVFNKKTDQVNLVLGVEGYHHRDPKRYAARLLGVILGEGMSSRLFREVREKRGLAYTVGASHYYYLDTGAFTAYGGLKLEKLEEALKVIRDQMEQLGKTAVSDTELKKAKEMERGRLALRQESTNFLAEHFGTEFVLDREIETFDEYLANIDAVTPADIMAIAAELFKPERYNLQMIGPLTDPKPYEALLK